MRIICPQLSLSFLLILVATSLVGCAAPTKKGDFLDPQLSSSEIDVVHVFPLVDQRLDRSVHLGEHWLRDGGPYGFSTFGRFSKISKQEATYQDDSSVTKDLPEDALTPPYTAIFDAFEKMNFRWALFFVLDDLADKKGVFSAPSARCRGVLLDNELERAVWSHAHAVEAPWVGPVGGLFLDENEAVLDSCFVRIIEAFPKNTG